MNIRSAAAVAAILVVAGAVWAAPSEEAMASGEDRLDAVGFHNAGYPIVDTPITVQAMIRGAAHVNYEFDDMTLIADLQERSNIDLVFETVPGAQAAEKRNLIFASREYPDLMLNMGVSDRNLWGAAQAGDVYALDEMIDTYAPNWKQAFAERPIVRKAITQPDGKIYSLPYYREILNDYGIRDTMAMNVDWLGKMGIDKLPDTTEEFYQALKAYRTGIDDGTLPENGVPWAGALPRLGQRRRVGAVQRLRPVDEGPGLRRREVPVGERRRGGVRRHRCQARGRGEVPAPPLLREPDYRGVLHQPGLRLHPALALGAADLRLLGFLLHHLAGGRVLRSLAAADGTHRRAPLPLAAGAPAEEPVHRSSASSNTRKRWCDSSIRGRTTRFSVEASYGGPLIRQESDGTRTVTGRGVDWFEHGPHNFFPTYVSKRAADKVNWTGEQGNRDRYIREIYEPYLWPQERHFAYITYTDEEQEELAVNSTEIANYIQTSIAKWMVDGGVEDGWDEYLNELDRLGLGKVMEIFQTAYDRFHGN